jgi:hypothetical protein
MVPGEGDEVRHPRHGAVVVHDLADHARGVEAGEAGEVDRGLGMAGADQRAAVPRHEGEDVAGRDDVLAAHLRVDGDGDCMGPVGGGDAGGHAVLRLDGDGEGGGVAGAVGLGHQRQAELLDPPAVHRQADQAAGEAGHEVDRVRRGELGGDDEVALVLAVLVIDQDEHAAAAGLLDQLLGGGDEVGEIDGLRRHRASHAWSPLKETSRAT